MGLEVIKGSGVDLGENEHPLASYLLQVALIEGEEFLLLARDALQISEFVVLRFYPTAAPFQF